MTEIEWMTATDLRPLLGVLEGKASSRKMRLFRVACLRVSWDRLGDDRSRRAVDVAEMLADGAGADAEAEAAQEGAYDVRDEIFDGGDGTQAHQYGAGRPLSMAEAAAFICRPRLDDCVREVIDLMMYLPDDPASLSPLVRDIFGNPFRPVTADPSWLTSTVAALARGMYETRDFSAMPILADALQNAGCDNEDVLNHCRQPGEHVRGCWVVDLVLGKK
jgi:hypothetical protein